MYWFIPGRHLSQKVIRLNIMLLQIPTSGIKCLIFSRNNYIINFCVCVVVVFFSKATKCEHDFMEEYNAKYKVRPVCYCTSLHIDKLSRLYIHHFPIVSETNHPYTDALYCF